MSQRERLWSGGPAPEDAPEPSELRPLPRLPGEHVPEDEPEPRRRNPIVVGMISALAGGAALLLALLVLGVIGGDDKPAPLPAAKGGAGNTRVGAIYAKASRGVVSIAARERGGQSTGTGFVIDRNGTIVTNAHVVGSAG